MQVVCCKVYLGTIYIRVKEAGLGRGRILTEVQFLQRPWTIPLEVLQVVRSSEMSETEAK